MKLIITIEFATFSKKFGIRWAEIRDPEIKPGKKYLIADRPFTIDGSPIDVVECVPGGFRRVATRRVRRGSPYRIFDLSSESRSKKQKPMLLHRARLIAFKGLDPANPIALHGSLGRDNHELANLRWGRHKTNMADLRKDGHLKGLNNGSAKITGDIAYLIYFASRLNLITKDLIKVLPISGSQVSAIANKKKWQYQVTPELEAIMDILKSAHKQRTKEIAGKSLDNEYKIIKRHIAETARHISKIIKSLQNQVNELLNLLMARIGGDF